MLTLAFRPEHCSMHWIILIQARLHQSAKERKKQLLSGLPKSRTANKKETKWSKVMRRSLSCLHIRPPLPTFDSQPPDLGFVRPSGAILPSIGIGIPSRCSHPRGFSIVSPGQRKKNHHSHPDVFFFVCVCVHVSPHVLTRLPSRFTPLPRHDEAIAGEFQTRFGQRHQNYSEKKKNEIFFPPPSFPSLWFVTCCGHRVSGSSPGSKRCLSHAEISFFMNILQLPPQITFAHWLWYGCPPQQEFISYIPPPPPPPPASVLHPSLIVIHNNSIKTSIQGLSPVIPDFKTKDIHLGKGAFMSSYWQTHSTRSQPSPFSLFSVPSARRLFAFSTLLSLSRSMLTGGALYVGSNGGEARSKVALCLPKPWED